MLGLSLAKLAAVSAGALAAGSVTVVVLVTSGPFANQDSSDDEAIPTTATVVVEGETTGPSPTPEPYKHDEVLRAGVPVDMHRLPTVDDSDWVTFVAPNGSLTMRLPASWHIRTATNLAGQIVPGDTLTVRSGPPEEGPGEGESRQGWVKLDGATTPFEVPIEAGADATVATTLFDDGRRVFRAFQYDAEPGRGDPHPRMVLTLQECSEISGLCISLVGTVDFDVTASVLASAVQAVYSVEVHLGGFEAPYPPDLVSVVGELAEAFFTLEEITAAAPVIVVARIEAIAYEPFHEFPYTVAAAVVEVSSRGQFRAGETITVVEVGGVFAGRSKTEPGARGEPREVGFEGVPVMKPGERYLLFLDGPDHVGPVPSGAYSVKGVVQGKVRVGADGRLQFTGAPGSIDEPIFAVPRALVGRPYADVRAEVEAIVRR